MLDYSINGDIGVITIKKISDYTKLLPGIIEWNELKKFFANPLLKGVFIKCTGNDFFTDIEQYLQENKLLGEKDRRIMAEAYYSFLRTIAYANIPTAAIIRGECFGENFQLALSCHFRFASNTAIFGFPSSNKTSFLRRDEMKWLFELLKKQDLISLLLSDDVIDCNVAEEKGLVDFVSKNNSIMSVARKYLISLTEKRSPELIRTIMQSIHNGTLCSKKEALYKESLLFDKLLKSLKS